MLLWLVSSICTSIRSPLSLPAPKLTDRFLSMLIRLVYGLLLLALLGLAWGLSGCAPLGTPLIRQFSFVGQDPNRRNVFYFKIQWEDADGNLASANKNARVVLKIENPDDRGQTPIEFATEFGSVQIPEGTRAGTMPDDKIPAVQVAAEIREEDPTKPYPTRLKVTATLYDSAGNASNKPWIIIQKDNTN